MGAVGTEEGEPLRGCRTRWVPRKGQLVFRQQVQKGFIEALGQERSLEMSPGRQWTEPSGPRKWLTSGARSSNVSIQGGRGSY